MASLTPSAKDALVTDFTVHLAGALTFAATARCECGHKHYSAVSSSEANCERIIRRKHRKHLEACRKQRELNGGGVGMIPL